MKVSQLARIHALITISMFSATMLLSACGGGGSSNNGNSSPTATTPPPVVTPTPTPPTPPTPPTAGTPAMGCGNVTSTGTGNTTQIVVDGFPCAAGGGVGQINQVDQPYVSVKICAPGSTTNCQIIDHIILDTGSTGLHIMASALSPSLQPGATGLPLMAGSAGTTLTECEVYVTSYVYGPLATADVYIAGEAVKNLPMQVIAQPGYTTPTACSKGGGTATQSTASFGGNGIIGVSFASVDSGLFFDCNNSASGTCVNDNSFVGLPHPVQKFATDNNGISITMPAISTSGVASAVGTLTFGISTQTNNVPSTSTIPLVLGFNTTNGTDGDFQTLINGYWQLTYMDSGTTEDTLLDAALPACTSASGASGLYCPTSVTNVSIGLADFNTSTVKGTLTTPVGNASTLGASTNLAAFNDLIYTNGTAASAQPQVIGFSNFFGHTMWVLFENSSAQGTGLGGTANTKVTGPMYGVN
ncbi:DUF3443 family protein [Solimicrobium silvestre]|uniref:DUF3443 family protein n=1 Tax=Solimicrobium silvestre TaxID=2099400 RepID=A0A2S9GY00_9BURK|nr:DUF3443 family protein [Solimicrobium silvestre]PRC92580.1 hypothetical protein S2091_2635 [Solimicrobium silvestre]